MTTRTAVVFSQFPCFLHFLFRDPCTSKVFLLFLKRFFFVRDRHINEQQAMTAMTGLFALISLSVWTGMSQSIVTIIIIIIIIIINLYKIY